MNDTLQNLQVGDNVRVKIANSYEYGTITGIENGEVLIQLSEALTREVSFEDFIELGYEVVINR
jgi:sRNA-binding protein